MKEDLGSESASESLNHASAGCAKFFSAARRLFALRPTANTFGTKIPQEGAASNRRGMAHQRGGAGGDR
jgi:hypothetical protein